MTTEHRSPGRPRRAETDDRIIRATQELIREQGPGAVNVAAVAARSGIARTTIYRRHQDRRALLSAALQPITDQGEPPAGTTVRAKFLWMLERTEEVLGSGIGAGGVAAVLTDADMDFSAALRDSLERGLQPILEQIRADRASGLLIDAVEPDMVLDLALGSYLAASLRRGAPGIAWREETAAMLTRVLSDPTEPSTMSS